MMNYIWFDSLVVLKKVGMYNVNDLYKKAGDWYIEWQRVTMGDNEWYNEWQRIQRVATNDNWWYNEWQRVLQRVATNESE